MNEKGVLLCKRAIKPVGLWTLPAGFLEGNETIEEGAQREAWEEATARIKSEGILAIVSDLEKFEVQIFFRASLKSKRTAPGPESLEVRIFSPDRIPWDELAFPSVSKILLIWLRTRKTKLSSVPMVTL